ncbi:MAG: hypothetical protein H5T34_04980 [Candidatus Methanomethyliales bacterium]|nr:hypothetical protein [Candidatus Methanomethylicales archaeon]
MPMSGVFSFVRFKKGGPYGSEGTYISNMTAFGLLLAPIFISHFILSPTIRAFVESLCSSDPIIGYALILIALGVIWTFISKSRKKE